MSAARDKPVRLTAESISVEVLKPGCFKGLDLVFFSSGDDISKEWAPQAVKDGAVAIDNSAAFRMDPDKILVVPEVNGDLLPKPGQAALVANPNCSTIQLVVALQPLMQDFGLVPCTSRLIRPSAVPGAKGKKN